MEEVNSKPVRVLTQTKIRKRSKTVKKSDVRETIRAGINDALYSGNTDLTNLIISFMILIFILNLSTGVSAVGVREKVNILNGRHIFAYCSNFNNQYLPPCQTQCVSQRIAFYNRNGIIYQASLYNVVTRMLVIHNTTSDYVYCTNLLTDKDCNDFAESGGLVTCGDSGMDLNCGSSNWCYCEFATIQTIRHVQDSNAEFKMENMFFMDVCLTPVTFTDVQYQGENVFYTFDYEGVLVNPYLYEEPQVKRDVSANQRSLKSVVVPSFFYDELTQIACTSSRASKDEVFITVSREASFPSLMYISYGDSVDALEWNDIELVYQLPKSYSLKGTVVDITILNGTSISSMCSVVVNTVDECLYVDWWFAPWDCASFSLKFIYVLVTILMFLAAIALIMFIIACLIWTFKGCFRRCIPRWAYTLPVLGTVEKSYAWSTADALITADLVIGSVILFLTLVMMVVFIIRWFRKKQETEIIYDECDYDMTIPENDKFIMLKGKKKSYERTAAKRRYKIVKKRNEEEEDLITPDMTPEESARAIQESLFRKGIIPMDKKMTMSSALLALLFIPLILGCDSSFLLNSKSKNCQSISSTEKQCTFDTYMSISIPSVGSEACLSDNESNFELDVKLESNVNVLNLEFQYYTAHVTYAVQNNQDCDAGTGLAQCDSFGGFPCDPTNSPSSFGFTNSPYSVCKCYDAYGENGCVLSYSKIFGSINPLYEDYIEVYEASTYSNYYTFSITKTDANGTSICEINLGTFNNYYSTACGITLSVQEENSVAMSPVAFLARPEQDLFYYVPAINKWGSPSSCSWGWNQYETLPTNETAFSYIYNDFCIPEGPSSWETNQPWISWSCCSDNQNTYLLPYNHGQLGMLRLYQSGGQDIVYVTSPNPIANLDVKMEISGNFTFEVDQKTVVPVVQDDPYTCSGCYGCQKGASFTISAKSTTFDGVAHVDCGSTTIRNPVISLTSSYQDYEIEFSGTEVKTDFTCSLDSGNQKSDKFEVSCNLFEPQAVDLGNVTKTVAPAPNDNISSGGMDPLKWLLFVVCILILFCVLMALIGITSFVIFKLLMCFIPKKFVDQYTKYIPMMRP